MAGVSVAIDASDLVELGRSLRRLAKASLAPLMDDIAGVGEESAIKRIHDGGPAPDGTPWPARHPANPSPHALLNQHGGLVDSIEGAASGDTAVWGSSLVYARIHQLGGDIVPTEKRFLKFAGGDGDVFARKVTLPARPYLGYGDAERQGVEGVVEAWLEGALGGRRR